MAGVTSFIRLSFWPIVLGIGFLNSEWKTVNGSPIDYDAEVISQTSQLIPLYAFFRSPSYDAPALSPNGNSIAYLSARNGVLNIWVRSVEENNDQQVTFEKKQSIRRYFWSPDSTKIFYLQDNNGDENWHLFGIDLLTHVTRDYTPFDNVHASIVAVDNSVKDHILIALNKENAARHDVYKLTISNGTLALVARNPGTVIKWFADRSLRVRLAIKKNNDGGSDILYRAYESMPWKTLFSWSYTETLSCSVIDFSFDGKEIYCLDNRDNNTVALVTFNLASGVKKVLFLDDHYDISAALLHPSKKKIQGYSIIKQRKETTILDEDVKADFDFLRMHSIGDLSIVSRDHSDAKWIIAHITDNGPITYYYYDRNFKQISTLFENKPELHQYELANTESITITARDGLTLEGYCTKPSTSKPGQLLPMVILVHGGPWQRDNWGYNMEAQWLANRGYVCLQVNYRGSTGYGKAFLAAGEKEWGGKMLDDLVDAAQWAIDLKIADPEKIGIMGTSYGGYAALCAATMTDKFACGISVSGPVNLTTFLTTLPPYFDPAKKLLYSMIGNPDSEEYFLKMRSPLFHTDNLKVPLLIAQGRNDQRVKNTESKQMVHALISKKLVYDYLLFPDEGHGLVHEKNRLLFYTRAELFLARTLHGLHETQLL